MQWHTPARTEGPIKMLWLCVVDLAATEVSTKSISELLCNAENFFVTVQKVFPLVQCITGHLQCSSEEVFGIDHLYHPYSPLCR